MPSVAARLPLYASLTRLDKPVGTLLLLWPTLTALWVASDGAPNAMLVAIFIAGTFLMRSAGCAINDAADARFDAHVKRTANRVVARGLVSQREAIAVAIALGNVANNRIGFAPREVNVIITGDVINANNNCR